MEITKSSVWLVKRLDGLQSGKYRVLDLYPEFDTLVLYPLSIDCIDKPRVLPISTFKEAFYEKSVVKDSYELPPAICQPDNLIPKIHKSRRDRNFNLISPLIENRSFLYSYASKSRSRELSEYCRNNCLDRKNISRLLNKYWKYGQTKGALLPAYYNSGAPGKERTPKSTPLGSPRRRRTIAFDHGCTYIVRQSDKDNFRKALKKHHLKPNGKTLKETYRELLREYYSEEVKRSEESMNTPYVPSYRQLCYWKNKLYSPNQLIAKTTTEHNFALNKRATLGSVSEKWPVPGSCFEIDATVADVHIVSSFGKQYCLGRPTIYTVVDRASAMIVGLHVSLYYASWRAASQALANTYLPKQDYCKEFGISISEDEWPAHHISQRLMCDNGEMIGLKPQETVPQFTELQFSPPYRPDFKSMVERRFGLLNDELIHQLSGTTRGGIVIRGDRDPRKDAIHTLKEFNKLLIEAVLELNSSQYDSLAFSSPILIEKNLAPTPINFWRAHIDESLHALKHAEKNEVISRLYQAAESSMTRDGILYNRLYYSCDQVVKDNLASLARSSGRWPLETRVNENTADYIFVRFSKYEHFTKCRLLPKSRVYEGRSMCDLDFSLDWLDKKSEEKPINVKSIERRADRDAIKKEAKNRAKQDSLSFREKTSNTRTHRSNEISLPVTEVDTVPKRQENDQINSSDGVKPERVVYLPRRKNKRD